MEERPKLSVAIIAKDAEDHIGRTIESVLPVADQVVVVIDDRTTDRTEGAIVQAGRSYYGGCPGLEKWAIEDVRRPWTHSFSEARNAALDLCDGPWIMTMDADEDMDEEGVEALNESLLHTPDNGGPDLYHAPLLVDPTYGTPSYHHDDFGPCGIVFRDRIFWKPSGSRWRFRVHENLWFPGPEGFDQFLNVRFYHRGRMNPEKSDYYTALLYLDHIDFPEEPVPATMLAEAAIGAGDLTRAAAFLDAVDPDLVQGLNGSKYWIAKGKCSWNGFLLAATGQTPGVGREQGEALRDEAVACYLKGHEQNRADHDGAILAASALFTAYPDTADAFAKRPPAIKNPKSTPSKEAIKLLKDVCRRDPHCVVARKMLALWGRFGGPGGDRAVFGKRLVEYLKDMANVETDARLEAERVSTDPAIANVERLDQILNAGGRQARRPNGSPTTRESRKRDAESLS